MPRQDVPFTDADKLANAMLAFKREETGAYEGLIELIETLQPPAGGGLDAAAAEAEAALSSENRDGLYEALQELQRELVNRQPITTKTWEDIGTNQPDRGWLVTDWMPTGCVTILSGRGGFGKSRLALQLAAGVASGGGYPEGERNVWLAGPTRNPLLLGTAVGDGVPVLYVSWEDDGDEFSNRLAAISSSSAAPWVSPASLSELHFADMAGRGPTWGPSVGGHISARADLLPVGERLRERADKLEAQLVILDPLAAAWMGNENDRSLVRAFMADWDAWARQRPCGVMMVAHEPKSRESGPAGSTDWEAAARAVWTLGKEKYGLEPKGKGTNKPPDERTEEWKLELVKSNYSKPEALKMNLDVGPGGVKPRGVKPAESVRWCIEGPWDDEPKSTPEVKRDAGR